MNASGRVCRASAGPGRGVGTEEALPTPADSGVGHPRPRETPVRCDALSRAEATPASCGATPYRAVLEAGMNTPARPKDIRSSETRTCDQYADPWSIVVSQSMPATAMTRPGTINALGPVRGSSWATIPAEAMMPRLNGRNAKPDFSGLQPRLTWK